MPNEAKPEQGRFGFDRSYTLQPSSRIRWSAVPQHSLAKMDEIFMVGEARPSLIKPDADTLVGFVVLGM